MNPTDRDGMNRAQRRATARGKPVYLRETVPASFQTNRQQQPQRIGANGRTVKVDP